MNANVTEIPNFLNEKGEESAAFVDEKMIDVEIDETSALSCEKENNRALNFLSKVIKRFIDICAGIVGTLILIPLTLVVWVFNKFNKEDAGPLFFIQERIGQNGKMFKMIKFRSMCVDADEKLKKFLEENESIREEFYIYRKIKNDPRVTKIGRILRKTSLDEFPQFINVLKGEMSLVGPRPYLPREKQDMGTYYKVIVKHKPGITGLWQTQGRSDVTFDDRLDMDVKYHKTHSNINDMKIVLKTVENVISKKGAI